MFRKRTSFPKWCEFPNANGEKNATTRYCQPWLDYSALLDPSPMPLETGIKRLDDGSLLVAVRTDYMAAKDV